MSIKAANGHHHAPAEALGDASQRMQSAATRAIGDSARVRRHIEKLNAEMDDLTPGPPMNIELHEEDSLVTSIGAVIASAADDD